MVKQLLEASSVDFKPANEECQLALSSALNWQRLDIHIQKSVEIIKYFLDHGFDVNCEAQRDQSCFNARRFSHDLESSS